MARSLIMGFSPDAARLLYSAQGPASVQCGSCREDRSLPVKIANIDEPASSSNR